MVLLIGSRKFNVAKPDGSPAYASDIREGQTMQIAKLTPKAWELYK
jgi:hypothetical protein